MAEQTSALALGPSGPVRILRIDADGPVAVIGDIHGRADLLGELIGTLPRGCRIVVVGDVCDRGPDTPGVIDLLIEHRAVGALGNHDQWLLDWASGRGFDRAALGMGGDATLRSYGAVGRTHLEIEQQSHRVPRPHVEWLRALAHGIDLRVNGESYWVVHAGIPSSRSFEGLSNEGVVPWLVENHPLDLLWAFSDPEAMLPVDRPVIMGHTCRRRPIDTGDVMAIDTGCGTTPDGYLTAVLLPERRFVSVGR